MSNLLTRVLKLFRRSKKSSVKWITQEDPQCVYCGYAESEHSKNFHRDEDGILIGCSRFEKP